MICSYAISSGVLLVVCSLRRSLEGALFGIPDDVVGFHRIVLAYSWLPGLLDVVEHVLSEPLAVVLFDSLAVEGDPADLAFFFTPISQVPVIFKTTGCKPPSGNPQEMDRVVWADIGTQRCRCQNTPRAP